MTLTLEVIGEQAAKLGPAARKTFRDTGGTIGRLPDNAWPLPDPYVSSRHAVITFVAGTFYIEDRNSRNGVFINSPENRLAPGQAHALRTGDWILIEPYEIRVAVEDSQKPAASDPFGLGPSPLPSGFAPGHQEPSPLFGSVPTRPDPLAGFDSPNEKLDPLEALFGPSSPAPVFSGPKAADLAGGSPLEEPFVPPPVRTPAPPPSPPASLLPDDWDRTDSDIFSSAPAKAVAQPAVQPPPAAPARVPPADAPPPMSSAPSPADRQLDLNAVMAGAGLEHLAASPEFARDFGRILRIVVEGLMDVLRTRREFKSEFRLDMTTLRPAENNPLKFSANVEDALHNLLVKRNPAYLGTVDAFDDAFDDVRNDQMAMLAGMRAAFDAMLQEFDPERLQQAFDQKAGRGALISAPAKLRYWDQYREKFRDMVRDPEKCFRDLFGDEFASAYEEHLKQLKSHGRR